jgi:hypothetical protein
MVNVSLPVQTNVMPPEPFSDRPTPAAIGTTLTVRPRASLFGMAVPFRGG